MITSSAVYFIWRYKKRRFSSSRFFSTRKLSDIFNHDVEGGSIYFGISVFSYSELEEATDDFNSSRVLGDGGYGTVYYGEKLLNMAMHQLFLLVANSFSLMNRKT